MTDNLPFTFMSSPTPLSMPALNHCLIRLISPCEAGLPVESSLKAKKLRPLPVVSSSPYALARTRLMLCPPLKSPRYRTYEWANNGDGSLEFETCSIRETYATIAGGGLALSDVYIECFFHSVSGTWSKCAMSADNAEPRDKSCGL